jgi:hypothetical protein
MIVFMLDMLVLVSPLLTLPVRLYSRPFFLLNSSQQFTRPILALQGGTSLKSTGMLLGMSLFFAVYFR